jgi:hypothetical protein
MTKQLFKKSEKAKSSKVKTAEKENLALSTKPSYILDVLGKNIGTTKKISDDAAGEKTSLSGRLISESFLNEKQEINSNGSTSVLGSIINNLFK